MIECENCNQEADYIVIFNETRPQDTGLITQSNVVCSECQSEAFYTVNQLIASIRLTDLMKMRIEEYRRRKVS